MNRASKNPLVPTAPHQENIDFTYRALSVLNTAYCDLMMFLSPIKQKVSKPDRA